MQATSRSFSWPIFFVTLGVLVVAAGLCASCLSLSIALDTSGDIERSAAQSYLLCFFFLALPMTASGIASILFGVRQRRHEKEQRLHNFILDLAAKNDGVVTATELALHSTLPLNQAQDYLDQLAARGICQMELTENGTTCFVFEHRRALDNDDDNGWGKEL
jgi:predicted transcriptional regulator